MSIVRVSFLRIVSVLLLSCAIGVSADLLVHLPFDGNALDQSGNMNHGSPEGATLTLDRFGVSDSAYFFNGSGQRIELPVVFAGDQDPISILVWIKPEEFSLLTDNHEPIFGEYGQGFDARNQFWYQHQHAFFDNFPPGGGSARADFDFGSLVGQWFHLGVVKVNDIVTFYVDGLPIATRQHSETYSGASPSVAAIGARRENGNWNKSIRSLHGALDEVMIYDNALTAVEVLEIYNLTGPASEYDFGDAPVSYGTLVAAGGAQHLATGPQLGVNRDTEADGAPSLSADGDDLTGTSDDEDGVIFSPVAGFDKNVSTSNSISMAIENGPADYEVWVDWNRDGDFSDSGELADSGTLATGTHNQSISVPATAIVGNTYARIRVYDSGTRLDSGVGLAASGEVEDYQIVVSDTTLVDLLSYDVVLDGDSGVEIRWTTGAEIDSAGFNLLRYSEEKAERYEAERLNDAMIPAKGNTVEGDSYQVIDSPGYGRFIYQLEEIEVDGSRNLYSAKSVTIGPILSVFRKNGDRIVVEFSPLKGWNYELQSSEVTASPFQWESMPGAPHNSGAYQMELAPIATRVYRLIATQSEN